jgi:hypothetical protein
MINTQGEKSWQEEDEAKSHQSVNWTEYFNNIKSQCPWGYHAWSQGLIDIVEYQDVILPLGRYQARIYYLNTDNSIVTAIAEGLDLTDPLCEWLWSYPGYGTWATPVSCLIQQNRQHLNQIRSKLKSFT